MPDSHATPDRVAVPELPKEAAIKVFVNAAMLLRQHMEWDDVTMILTLAVVAEKRQREEREATRQ